MTFLELASKGIDISIGKTGMTPREFEIHFSIDDVHFAQLIDLEYGRDEQYMSALENMICEEAIVRLKRISIMAKLKGENDNETC